MSVSRQLLVVPYLALSLLGCGDDNSLRSACNFNSDCAATELCATGACPDGVSVGECVERPTECGDTVSDVCGCDGVTYQSACFASQAGIRLSLPIGCFCADDSTCTDQQLCFSTTSCGGSGNCQTRPLECPDTVNPVCGCDGQQYDNSCLAEQAGVRVSAAQLPEGASCDCNTNEDCAPTDFCNNGRTTSGGTVTGSCDGPGFCETRPIEAECPPDEVLVDGCDNVEYTNFCFANAAGVRVAP